VSETADIANARIEFENGCVANLTASRISLKKMRKMRLFQRDAYLGIDFLEKKTEVVRLGEKEGSGGMRFPIETATGEEKIISVHTPEVPVVNAIHAELADFVLAIETGRQPQVSVQDGYRALEIAHQILEHMDAHRVAASLKK
jgi:predicted dehydrogenase